MFDAVYVINLDRRRDRLDRFREALDAIEWPWSTPQRFAAVDGDATGFPPWWTAGGGAWGCLRSHCGVLERAMSAGEQRILILEDDAIFHPRFHEEGPRVLLEAERLGWDQLYFGGQHLKPPLRKGNSPLVGSLNVNRTHAYAVQGDFMRTLYQWIQDPKNYRRGAHVDHCMGRLHELRKYKVWAPREWLVGQAEGKSNISGREAPERFWGGNPRDPLGAVAVVGPYRSGTSFVAGVCHHLGVHMGVKFLPPNEHNPRGYWEANQLRKLCIQATGDTQRVRMDHDQLVHRLKVWLSQRKRDRGMKSMVGGKHPSLCVMVPELLEAWGPQTRFIRVRRDLSMAAESLAKTGWFGTDVLALRRLLGDMAKKADEDLKKATHVLEVDFESIRHDSEEVACRIAQFLKLPTRTAARDFCHQFVH